jgi:hypothetical protein
MPVQYLKPREIEWKEKEASPGPPQLHCLAFLVLIIFYFITFSVLGGDRRLA